MEIKNLSVHYKEKKRKTYVEAVKDFDYHFKQGKTYAVIGPSGCGKSSLLLAMAGLIPASQGQVLYKGQPVTGPSAKFSLILQDYGLFPWKTVWENAILGLSLRSKVQADDRGRVSKLLEFLGIAGYGKRYPKELSGGQRQRVAIARALATEPDLLLMDEPLSALDALTRESMQDLLVDIWREQELTMVVVTHNIEEAVFLGQEIIVMTPSPGQIGQVISNPYAGDHAFRSSDQFYKYCSEIRQALQDGESSREGGASYA